MKVKYIFLWLMTSGAILIFSYFFNLNPVVFTLLVLGTVGISFKVIYEIMASFRKVIEKEAEIVEEETKEVRNMRSEFVANVSHELKTPITSISGFIETLQEGAVEDAKTREKFINIIAEETERLKRLVDDILFLSDIENQRQIKNENILIKDAIGQICEILSPISVGKGISISNQVPENLEVLGEVDRFKQMMLNLIENGIKYGKSRGNVWIGASEDKEKISIWVKDDGIGIAKTDLTRVTERFYRVDKSRSNVVGGTGLGLSIVKHTARSFNGELKITSNLGEGSTFTIEIDKK